MIIIYLDICCYNRPFDDKSQVSIQLESNAKLFIQKEILNGAYELIWSFMLDHENKFNPHKEQRKNIQEWKNKANSYIVPSEIIFKKSMELESKGIHKNDVIHIACAINSNADYFITTDYDLIKKQINEIKIINPIEFIYEMEGRR
jgi:predicted nucleic acid-binding protein